MVGSLGTCEGEERGGRVFRSVFLGGGRVVDGVLAEGTGHGLTCSTTCRNGGLGGGRVVVLVSMDGDGSERVRRVLGPALLTLTSCKLRWHSDQNWRVGPCDWPNIPTLLQKAHRQYCLARWR